jgi:hypothetical protein
MISKKICIIGSGAASYFAIKHLVDVIKVEPSDIDLITTGSLESSNTLYPRSMQNKSLSERKMAGVIPEKLLFGSDEIYQRECFNKLDLSKLKYIPKSTHFFGGLTHIWGANLSLLTDADLKSSNDLLPLARYDAELFSEFNASGRVVNGRQDNRAKLVDRKKYVNDPHVHKIITHHQYESKFGKFKIAYSNLAINVSEHANGCIYCGECLVGCRTKSIWSAAMAFENLDCKNQINTMMFSKVQSILIDANHAIVAYIQEGVRQERRYEKVFIAAGVLDTIDLLANSQLLPSKAKIHDSTKYYTLFFTLKRSKLDCELNNISLSSLTYQYATKYGTIHSQIYPSVKILSDILAKLPLLKFIKKFVAGHFKIGMIYLPEGMSDQVVVNKELERYQLSHMRSSVKIVLVRAFFLLSHYISSLMHFLPLRYIKIPFYYRVPILNSQHFGNLTDYDGVHINDILPRNIKVIDTAGLRYVTGIPTTLVVAANAKYELDKAYKNES